MNMRGLLSTHKMEGTLIAKLNDYLFAFVFFVSRIFMYPVILYRLVYGNSLRPEGYPAWKLALSYKVITLFIGMYAIQIIWASQIIKAAMCPQKEAETKDKKH